CVRTRSSSNLVGKYSSNPTSSNPKHRNRRRSKQPFILEESPVATMADQHTMAELLRAPTEGYAEAIVVPPILAEQFELKHSLINMMTSDQFFRLEKDNPHDHIRWFNKITSTIKYKDVTNSEIKLMLFPFSLAWDRYKDLFRACPHHGSELHQLDSFYNALSPADQDSLNSDASGNLLKRRTQDVLTIIENKSKIAKLTHAVNQQTSAVTTAMTAILKQFQATPPLDFVKAIEEIYITCGVAVNYNQGNSGYRPLGVANQIRPSGFAQLNVQNNQNRFSQPQGYNRENNFNQDSSYQAPVYRNQVVPLSELEKIKKMNEINIKAMQTQINNVKNELRNEMKTSIQASMSNQTNKLKNIMASFFQMNTASTSGLVSLPSNTIANPKGELKSITTRIGLVLDGPSVPISPPFINPEEDERVEETLMDLELDEFTIKVPPSLDAQAKAARKVKVQIHKFWKMFKQLHINITLADALILIPKYQKMLKALLSNKEKLLELENTPLNENYSAVILKKLPKKLGDPGKFLIPCGFSELKCKALTDLANQAICTLAGIARDVFVSVRKFTFPTDFVIVDYESDPRVPLILGRPFLRTARALIDVHGEEMILPTTSSSPNHLLEEFTDELALITFPLRNDDLPFDIESDLREIEYLLNQDPTKEMDSILEDSIDEDNLADPNDNLFDTISRMFTDKHAPDYSSPPLYDDFDDDLDEFESDNEYVYDDPFDSKGEKIKESKLLIDELDLPRSSDFLPSLEYDSFLFEDFPEVDALPSIDKEDKVFNPGILIHENLFEVITRVTPDKNVKKIAISHASLILEDFDPPLYELPFHKEVLGSETLLSFSSKNEEKVFKPGILTSKGVHTSLLLELSHRGPKAFKVIKTFESPMEIFPCSYGEDIRILDVSCLHFYPP
nr:hypothetical protein [Tanacetum cinerariifolium]